MSATPAFDEFRIKYEQDDNLWWAMECGHHQNLFEGACDEVEILRRLVRRMEVTSENELTGEEWAVVVRAHMYAPEGSRWP